MELQQRIDAITRFEAQISEAEATSEALEGADARYVPAVLAMFERNATEDDFGVFGAFANYLEEFGADTVVGKTTVGALLLASVRRRPMWKTCELLPGLAGTDAAAALYTELLTAGGLDESASECVTSSLAEIVRDFPDEVEAATLAAAKKALPAS